MRTALAKLLPRTELSISMPSYNPSNELTSTPSGSYTYDANGNTLADPSGKQYTS